MGGINKKGEDKMKFYCKICKKKTKETKLERCPICL